LCDGSERTTSKLAINRHSQWKNNLMELWSLPSRSLHQDCSPSPTHLHRRLPQPHRKKEGDTERLAQLRAGASKTADGSAHQMETGGLADLPAEARNRYFEIEFAIRAQSARYPTTPTCNRETAEDSSGLLDGRRQRKPIHDPASRLTVATANSVLGRLAGRRGKRTCPLKPRSTPLVEQLDDVIAGWTQPCVDLQANSTGFPSVLSAHDSKRKKNSVTAISTVRRANRVKCLGGVSSSGRSPRYFLIKPQGWWLRPSTSPRPTYCFHSRPLVEPGRRGHKRSIALTA